MTVDQLRSQLADLEIPGDYEVRIDAMGGIGFAPSITKISRGFDWDANSVMLHPSRTLTVKTDREAKQSKQLSALRRLIREMRSFWPSAEVLDDLDDDEKSRKRSAPYIKKAPSIKTVRQWDKTIEDNQTHKTIK